jgi:hypothetical protein
MSTAPKAKVQASPVETEVMDTFTTLIQSIGDITTLYKFDDALTKRIRALEKATRGKPKKERDPDAPKKTAGPQLLAWNAQVARVQTLSAEGSKGMLTYNHAKAVASIMKAAGLLVVKKEASVLPTDAEILKAVEGYYKTHNPPPYVSKEEKEGKEGKEGKKGGKSKKIQAKKEEEEEEEEDEEVEAPPKQKSEPKPKQKEEPKAKTKEEPKAKAKEQSKEKPKSGAKSGPKEEPQETILDLEPYDYIIDGKSYERIDANGYAFIWDAKGKYMGVYNEKKKTFDTSVPDPTM